MFDGISPLDGRGLGGGVFPGGSADVLRRDPGDFGHLFRGIILDLPS